MKSVFEEKRKQALKATMILNISVIISSTIFASLSLFLANLFVNNDEETMVIFCFWAIIPTLLLVYNIFRFSIVYKEYSDYRCGKFYNIVTGFHQNYIYLTYQISGELINDCLFHENDIYITKNWIIDFNVREPQLLNIQKIRMVYVEFVKTKFRLRKYDHMFSKDVSGFYYLVCILEDASRVVFKTHYGKKAVKQLLLLDRGIRSLTDKK
jgi:hypothetical protein